MRREFKDKKKQPSYTQISILIIAILLMIATCFMFIRKTDTEAEQTKTPTVDPVGLRTLNTIDVSSLSPLQTEVLTLVKKEYIKSPKGYDDTVMNYTEGFEESWCADFISWILNEAGSPNISSDTGYWRIPGVLSLQTYYKEVDAYKSVDEGYSPKLGDVAFYVGKDTPDASNSEHAAMVLSYDGKTLVTIGGNEGDKRELRVRSESVTTNKGKALVGYGILE